MGSRYLLDAAKVAVQPSIVHQALRVKACVACQLPARQHNSNTK